MLDLKLYRY
ncbi:Protein of unknown function [Bacillus cytotoxicus]|nr:Protein of unknown function [Bacillus cytotoxicus]